MKRYMLRRILFSVFSLLVVIVTVMLLVYSLINKNVIFQTDDVWNKKSLNDRAMYEYVQYQRFGYLDYTDYSTFLRAFRRVYGVTPREYVRYHTQTDLRSAPEYNE